MKKTLSSLFALCIFGICQAQTFDDIILKKRYVDCRDVNYNAPELIRSLRTKGQIDSLYSFLDYWQTKCGDQWQIESIRTLLDIKTANFDSTVINRNFFYSLMGYKGSYMPYRWYMNPGYEFRQLQKNIRDENTAIARDIQKTYSTDESLLQDFYAADTATFDKIKNASPKESRLKQLYDEQVKKALRTPEAHLALFAGYYHPFGKLDVFGPHPSIGGILGVRQLRHTYDFVFDIRFGRSQNEYEVVYKGDLLKDDYWTSVYCGLEYTFDFIASKKVRLGLSPGIAYNGITAVKADDDDDNGKILPGLDLNGGLAFKYTFGKHGGYTGLQARYHWVDHRNPGGTELNGNYLSLRLVFGSIFNYDRDYKLRQLDY